MVDRLDRSEKWRNLVPLRFADYLEADALGDKIERGRLDDIARSSIWAPAPRPPRATRLPDREQLRVHEELAEWALQRGDPLRLRLLRRDLRRARGRWPTRHRPRDAAAAQHVRLLEASVRPVRGERGYLDRIVGLKYFNVFGPNEDHKGDMRSVVNKAFEQIRETGRVRLFKSYRPEYEDGEQQRDFLYVKDAVDMTLYLAEEPSRTASSTSARASRNLARARQRRLRRARTPGRHRVHRHAGRAARRNISTRPRRHRSAARVRLPAADDPTGRRRPRLRDQLSRPAGTWATNWSADRFPRRGDGGHGVRHEGTERTKTHEGCRGVSTSRPVVSPAGTAGEWHGRGAGQTQSTAFEFRVL